MTNVSRDDLLGVVLKEDKIKLIEVDSSTGNQFRINKITESKLDFPFDVKAIIDGKYITEHAEKLRNLVDKFSFNDNKAAFSIANNLVIIKKYPYDLDFSDEEIVDQVDWEVKKFSYSIDDEYIIDFQKIKSDKSKSTNEMIIVAVREVIINYIKKIFTRAKIKLQIVDTDVFAAIRAISKNYECRKGEIYALICLEKKEIQFTIIKSSYYFSSHQVTLELKPDISDVLVSDDVIKIISKELRKIILDNKLGEKIEDLNRIFLYGDMVQDDILESLQNNYNVRIDRTNPFRRLRFAQNVSVDEYIWSRPETFTVCVGSVLR